MAADSSDDRSQAVAPLSSTHSGGESAAGSARAALDSPGWARTTRTIDVWATAETAAAKRATLAPESLVEILNSEHPVRLFVRFPGDGQMIPPGQGWIEIGGLERSSAPSADELPRAYLIVAEPGTLRLTVPYRSQLDGSPWADANCGPATLAMALSFFGIDAPSADLRAEALDAQQMWGDAAGTLLDALAEVAQRHGIQPVGLFDGGSIRRWNVAEIRQELVEKRPVIVQVRFRALPQREESPYYGDHYIVLTGFSGEGYLYNDSVDSDGIGYDRIMSEGTLQEAMRASDYRYAFAAFSIKRSE